MPTAAAISRHRCHRGKMAQHRLQRTEYRSSVFPHNANWKGHQLPDTVTSRDKSSQPWQAYISALGCQVGPCPGWAWHARWPGLARCLFLYGRELRLVLHCKAVRAQMKTSMGKGRRGPQASKRQASPSQDVSAALPAPAPRAPLMPCSELAHGSPRAPLPSPVTSLPRPGNYFPRPSQGRAGTQVSSHTSSGGPRAQAGILAPSTGPTAACPQPPSVLIPPLHSQGAPRPAVALRPPAPQLQTSSRLATAANLPAVRRADPHS